MKASVWMGAAAVALVMTGAAHAQSGYAGLVYSNMSVDGENSVFDRESATVEGAIAFGDAITAELDGQVADGESATSVGLTAHLYKRTERFLIGAYAAYSDEDERSTTEYGVEGNLFIDRFTLAGSYGSATIDLGGGAAASKATASAWRRAIFPETTFAFRPDSANRRRTSVILTTLNSRATA